MEARFRDRAVIVTGAAGQIGTACVEAFAREGARVAAIDLELPRAPAGGAAVQADLAVVAELERAFAEAERAVGPVDVLVQSAATIARGSFLEIDAATIDRMLAVNVRPVLLLGSLAGRSLVARGARGAIVNITSIGDHLSEGQMVVYQSSKGAVTSATRAMAVALAPHGIRVNAVGPGSMAKPQGLPERDPHDLTELERLRIPLGRHGTGDDIAAAVLFLASEAAAFATGATLYVDGGTLCAF